MKYQVVLLLEKIGYMHLWGEQQGLNRYKGHCSLISTVCDGSGTARVPPCRRPPPP